MALKLKGLLGKAKRTTGAPANNAGPAKAAPASAPADPVTSLILADIALRAGSALLRRGVEKGVLGHSLGKTKAGGIVRGQGLGKTLAGTALARVATGSVPGAIVVGGGLIAKTLYDRRRAKKAKPSGD